ncbi:flagellar protein FlaG [Falsibacillus pallidus]|uniref:Flagellar protein FlaG n=1 Tax=Falsibacillus pallidus TaxID=493781 RepID=A0A370GCD6_9BACI|nr:flagellar protein FlaG [Falsibacillus pallidus]RDI40114.1 flagellar protein FlaG [Falsibacillus pallidus]
MIERVQGQTPTLLSNSGTVQKESTESKSSELVQSQKQEEKQQEVTKEKLEKVINSMNDFVSASNTHLKFEFHDKLKEYYVTIIDDKTQEVVKEIPSKKMLDMYAAMTEFLGLMVDKKI